MSLHLPHTVAVYLETDVVKAATLVVEGRSYSKGEESLAYVYPMKASAALEAGGESSQHSGLAPDRPHGIMWGVDDTARFPLGSLVNWGSRWFKVVSPTMAHEFGDVSDNCTAVLDELTFVPETA